jgi:hypothetical protein
MGMVVSEVSVSMCQCLCFVPGRAYVPRPVLGSVFLRDKERRVADDAQ